MRQIDDQPLNVLDEPLQPCSFDPLTGFYRTGCCETGPNDTGKHLVCARVTAAFLEYSRARGNDLITPQPQYGFPGLRPGDRWCLCVDRWLEALAAGAAPPIVLEASHRGALDMVPMDTLRQHATV